MEPWESFRTLVLLIFAILGAIGNAIWETYFAKKPFMGRNLFHCRDTFAAHTRATTQGFLAQNFGTQAIAMPGDDAQAAAMYAFLRAFGMALGLCTSGSVFQNVMNIRVSQCGLPESIARNAEAYIAVLWHSHSTPPNTEPILDSYVYGIDGVFGLFCGIAGLTGIASLFIGHFNLDRALQPSIPSLRTGWRSTSTTSHAHTPRRGSHFGGPGSPVVLVTGSGDSKPVLHLTIPSSSFRSTF
ncbi:hypothetical protein GQ44DRAFT_780269 [Phaeosphaeriaceae sp. PMI808]|nr:hypothetical protein GQ44DRAFT_780269 [Phaeosphaeriaceae sp. PMI808]